jgi:Uncharacterized conserved protein (DUF2358)
MTLSSSTRIVVVVALVLLLQLLDASSFILESSSSSSPTIHPVATTQRRTMTTTITTLHQTKDKSNNHHHQPQKKKNDGRLVSSSIMTNPAASSLTPSSSSSSSVPVPISVHRHHQLTPLEVWCTSQMDEWYTQSLLIKCPFFRRRMADLLDNIDMMMRFLIIRHKSLDMIGPPPGCRAAATVSSKQKQRIILPKVMGLTPAQTLELIRHDWMGSGSNSSEKQRGRRLNCGYYITGRLNTAIYRDDCWFDGPDPDMPVRGVRKYINAASHLFDHKTSTAELLDLQLGSSSTTTSSSATTSTIVATWRLSGVLHLPWKPKLPTWTGTTTYHLDQDGAFFIVCLFMVDWVGFGWLVGWLVGWVACLLSWRPDMYMYMYSPPLSSCRLLSSSSLFPSMFRFVLLILTTGLIYLHEETWDISVIQAFAETLWPEAAQLVFGTTTTSQTTTMTRTTTLEQDC